ncbi:hypothetical protein PVAND_005602 [Polypedilum vanderplanki]|uniref:C2H2-type domain-containing protein n=1 Tax=Polypedilum vanderplanki TaxID=319348 RepID=A0A9J6C0I1_POLVA|nr:hypothetical protein PVAND_005602 [Polypedilum vanderplanki]
MNSNITLFCFLCARDKSVTIEIESLTENERNKIGEYSVLNYNLPMMPTKICVRCHRFMKKMEKFQRRCESVEKMYIEILKCKDKSKIEDIIGKYNLEDDSDNEEESSTIFNIIPSSSLGNQDLNQISVEIFETIEEDVDHMEHQKRSKTTAPIEKPKILNPTALPKIENKIRLDILKCDLCEHKTSTKTAMENHMELHIKNEKLYECTVCQKKFASNRTLKNHSAIHMGVERKVYECSECLKILSSKTALNTHIKWHHSEHEFKCEICSKKLATKSSLTEHLKSHETTKHHKCPICSKKYKTASSLSNHLDIHSNIEYKCSICDLQLKSRRTLKQHEKVHSNVVLHKCEICGAEFKRTKTYKEHLITHTNMRPYKCDFCSKTFTNGPNCRKHIREVHPELDQAESNDRKKIVQLPKIDDLLQMTKMKS